MAARNNDNFFPENVANSDHSIGPSNLKPCFFQVDDKQQFIVSYFGRSKYVATLSVSNFL
jgi:hypothetical protein